MIRLLRWLPVLVFPAAAWAADAASSQPNSPPQVVPPQSAEQAASAIKAEALTQNQAALNLLKEVEALKAEVARLRGQAEMQAHQIESLSKRQSDLYVDLDKRMEDLNKQVKTNTQSVASSASPAVVVANTSSSVAPTSSQPQAAPATLATPAEDPLAESKSYEAALNLFRAGNYSKSIAGFASFLKSYPESTLASNALYWTGYAYYASKDYKNALAQQMKLVSEYPQSAKVPDAMLNIASNQMELNDLASAKKNLEELVAKYPGTNAAAIATKRLNLLK